MPVSDDERRRFEELERTVAPSIAAETENPPYSSDIDNPGPSTGRGPRSRHRHHHHPPERPIRQRPRLNLGRTCGEAIGGSNASARTSRCPLDVGPRDHD